MGTGTPPRWCPVLDGAIDRDAFEACVEQVPVPTLLPGDVVVRNNLSSHKGPRVGQRIEAAGARLLYLPPYSPIRTRSRWPSASSSYCSARTVTGR